MTYRATLEIVITMNELYLFNLRKQGQVRFKMTLHQKQICQQLNKHKNKQNLQNEEYLQHCNPYNIARKIDIKNQHKDKHLNNINAINKNHNIIPHYLSHNAHNYPNNFPTYKEYNPLKQSGFNSQPLQTQSTTSNITQVQSFIDFDGCSYFSKIFDTKYAQETHKIQQSVFFKCYIPVDKLNSTSLMIKVQLLFSPNQQNMFKLLGCFKGKIRKLSPISSYLPISFDQFQGFTINATYHTTIMQFKFEQSQQLQHINPNNKKKKSQQFSSLQSYIRAITSNFRRGQTKNFYFYYREYLEKQLFDLQQRHSDLIRILNLTNLIDFRFLKVTPNTQILSILNGLPILPNDKFIDKYTENQFIQLLLYDFVQLKGIIHQKWNNYVLFMTQYIDKITNYYKQIYDKNLKQRFKSNLFSHKIQSNHDWTFSKYQDSGKKYQQMAQNDRKKKKEQQLWSQLFPIEDSNSFQDQKTFIKMFQQIYTVKKQKKLIPPIKKFNLSTFSQLEENPHLYNNIYLNNCNQTNHYNQKYNQMALNKKAQFNKPSLSNIRKSSMITLGQNDFNLLKDRHHIQLGSNHYHRSQSLKEKHQTYHHFQNPYKNSSVKQTLPPNPNDKPQHIIILVHGYQASRQDFQVLKLCLQIRFKAKVFISSSNEGRTQDNVQAMGKRLAIQLARYFQNIDFTTNTRISFIGHSLGGVIIRSALGFLNNIQQFLYTYISFSSPHLGYLYEPSRLVKAGLWIMNSWQGSKCLNEICMKDNQDLRMSYFFRLSQNKALNHFKKIALISSSQDGYIPYESARIQKNSDILYNQLGDSVSRNVIMQMVDNLLGDIQAEQISRINVIFHIQDRNMDSIIGRTAHIKYLSDLKFIKMFFIVFEKFFV